jgi:hypothetical protein
MQALFPASKGFTSGQAYGKKPEFKIKGNYVQQQRVD